MPSENDYQVINMSFRPHSRGIQISKRAKALKSPASLARAQADMKRRAAAPVPVGPLPMGEKMLSVAQICARLGKSRWYVVRKLRQHGLRGVVTDGPWQVPEHKYRAVFGPIVRAIRKKLR